MSQANHIFDVTGKRGQAMRGFLDMDTKEIVIYDDKQGKEMFRIGGQGHGGGAYNSASNVPAILTVEITNGSSTRQTATLFASNLEPLIQPLGVTVVIKELENAVFNTHNYLRRDILSNKLKITGLTYIAQNATQLNNSVRMGTIKPYGVIQTKGFNPVTYFRENQVIKNRVKVDNFKWEVDARSIMYVPMEPNSKTTLLFTIVDNALIQSSDGRGNTNRTPIIYDGNSIPSQDWSSNFLGDGDVGGSSVLLKVGLAVVATAGLVYFALSKLEK